MGHGHHWFGNAESYFLVGDALAKSMLKLAAPAREPKQEPGEKKQAAFTVKRAVVYSKVGKRELRLDAYVPKKDGTYPAVLVVHGGAWASGNRYQLIPYATKLAEMGMACFAIDYRLAPKHKWPAQIDDCRAAVKWIRTNAKDYKVDPSRLGAIGYSAGGHLVALLATTGEAPNPKNGNIDTRLQAVAAGGAPAEFREFEDNGKFLTFLMGGDLDSVPEKFKSASPAVFLDKKDPPIFFWNGTKDMLVPMNWTKPCLLYTSPSPRDATLSRMPSSA